MNRFARQITLPGFGHASQQRLQAARVAVIGAGGLGCPILQYLAAAGVGFLRVVDGDHIHESNLNRQTLYGYADIGQSKARTAAETLQQQYPDLQTVACPLYLEAGNARELLHNIDLVIDGSDSIPTRYLLNDTCAALGLPWIMGAVHGFEGMLALWNCPEKGEPAVHYRDLYPEMPGIEQAVDCEGTGVLGVLPGIIGLAQASEAIRLLSACAPVQQGLVRSYDWRSDRWFQWQVYPGRGKACLASENKACLASDTKTRLTPNTASHPLDPRVLNWQELLERLRETPGLDCFDIREWTERSDETPWFPSWPGGDPALAPEGLETLQDMVLICKAGKRSLELARHLAQKHPGMQTWSVAGGWDASDQLLLDELRRIASNPSKNKRA
ncbi:MAG: HesA/MoeB/ThiF family protein [Bacteroidota bacterium]|jgi:adenylyltransferase/sulfurtransferase